MRLVAISDSPQWCQHNCIWTPHLKKGGFAGLEKVPKRTAQKIKGLECFPFGERLRGSYKIEMSFPIRGCNGDR